MDVIPCGGEFVCLNRGQAAADDDGLRILFPRLVEQVATLGGRGVSDRTCIDDKELRRIGRVHLAKTGGFEKLANLLAFVLVDFAAEC
jgi:hypothetical protein